MGLTACVALGGAIGMSILMPILPIPTGMAVLAVMLACAFAYWRCRRELKRLNLPSNASLARPLSGKPIVPRDPKGEKRPADVIGNAVKVMHILRGEEEDAPASKELSHAAELARQGGLKGHRRGPSTWPPLTGGESGNDDLRCASPSWP
jgi:hypothetical protein